MWIEWDGTIGKSYKGNEKEVGINWNETFEFPVPILNAFLIDSNFFTVSSQLQ